MAGAGPSIGLSSGATRDTPDEPDVTDCAVADTHATICENRTCNGILSGPVRFCPYCGQLQAQHAPGFRVAEPPPPSYAKAISPVLAPAAEQGLQLETEAPAQPAPPTPPQILEPALEIDWQPSSPPIAVPVETGVPAQKPDDGGQKPAVVDIARPEQLHSQPRGRVGVYIAGAVIAVGAYAAWSMFIQKPPQPEVVPAVSEQPSVTVQEPVTNPPSPPPKEPGPRSAIERRLANAQECLKAGDYGCSWRAVRSVLELEPNNDAALSIEDEIRTYVDRKVLAFEQALATDDLASARAALADAQKGMNYDRADLRFNDMSRRLDELTRAQQRSVSEGRPTAPTPNAVVEGPNQIVQELLSEAQQSLDRGDLNAAESLANNVLSRDAANPVAREILNRVEAEKERIKAVLMGSTEVKETVKVNQN